MFDNSRVATRLNLYDGLYRWLDNPPKLNPWPKAIDSENGLTYRFKLKDSTRFHDGSPVTAADVAYSIDRIIALNKGAAGLFTPIIKPGSTKAIDAVTVEFNLTKPAATFLSTVPEIHVVNSKLVKANEKDRTGAKPGCQATSPLRLVQAGAV